MTYRGTSSIDVPRNGYIFHSLHSFASSTLPQYGQYRCSFSSGVPLVNSWACLHDVCQIPSGSSVHMQLSFILSPPTLPLSGIRERTYIGCASGQRSRTPLPPGRRSLCRLTGRCAALFFPLCGGRPYQPAPTRKRRSRENCLVSP